MQIHCKLPHRITLVIMQFTLLIDGKYLSKLPKSYKYLEIYAKALNYVKLCDSKQIVPSLIISLIKMDHRLLLISFLS